MSESMQPSPENERPILSSGQFLRWHIHLADELDMRAKSLQSRLEEDPGLQNDPNFILETKVLSAEIGLLNRIGDDFSEHSIIIAMEKALHEITGENPGDNQ